MSKRHPEAKVKEEVVEPSPAPVPDADALRSEVERLAHQYWIERGSPVGTPDEDWFRAELEVRAKRDIAPMDKAIKIKMTAQ